MSDELKIAIPIPHHCPSEPLVRLGARVAQGIQSHIHLIQQVDIDAIPADAVQETVQWVRSSLLQEWVRNDGDLSKVTAHVEITLLNEDVCNAVLAVEPNLTLMTRSLVDRDAEAVRADVESLIRASGQTVLSVPATTSNDGVVDNVAAAVLTDVPHERRAESSPETPPARRELWVVEDDAQFRQMLLSLGQRNGYRSIGIHRGSEVLPRLAGHASHEENAPVLVLDHHLPEQCGLDILCSLRERGHELPVLFMSGLGPSVLEPATALGASEILQKPFGAEAFVGALRRMTLDDAVINPPTVGRSDVFGLDASETSVLYYGT